MVIKSQWETRFERKGIRESKDDKAARSRIVIKHIGR